MDITEVLAFSAQRGASGLHLSAVLPPLIRVDGDVRRREKKGGGRVAAHEIVRGTSAIRNLIREDKVAQMYSAIQTGQAIGMQTMDQCLQGLVEKRIITVDAAREKAREPYSIAL